MGGKHLQLMNVVWKLISIDCDCKDCSVLFWFLLEGGTDGQTDRHVQPNRRMERRDETWRIAGD